MHVGFYPQRIIPATSRVFVYYVKHVASMRFKMSEVAAPLQGVTEEYNVEMGSVRSQQVKAVDTSNVCLATLPRLLRDFFLPLLF